MSLSYRPLWIELEKRKIKRGELQELAGISGNVIAKLGNNSPISMLNIERICTSLDLTPSEVFEFTGESDK
ncbi:helix-turn-helix domain-containing protein [Clostridium algidicarnis]|uniref:Helix-turn-helix transcriptional regulator n=1 Tax=Clostridium algidicarnis TaxID=37659 RepID=A0ABS6C3D1_9CLOT|nr:helix-turn-helix transcriptional regulator [Clostridium algidicarnis]MBU3219966.1 helix-turn-helix transcriptional regulator [Clostridium algidicarnis]